MSTFLQKLRTVTLGTAHDLLDKAIDLNSPSALRQYVRDLEDALDRLRNEAAVAAGQIRTMEREKGDYESTITYCTQTAQRYVNSGKQDLARIEASKVLRAKENLARVTSQLETQHTTSSNLDNAVALLDAKHTDMVQRVRDLERIDRDSKAKEQAAGALSAAGKLVSGGADISVDDIESKMRARNDVANEKFSRAIGDVRVQEDEEHGAAVDDFLSNLAPKAKTAS